MIDQQDGAAVAAPEVEGEFYVTHKEFIGSVAMWAIAQSPLFPLRNLEGALLQVHEATRADFADGPDDCRMRKFYSRQDIRAYLLPILEKCPLVMDWNRTQHMADNDQQWPVGQAGFAFTSRHDDDRYDPMHDFVDIGALSQNVFNHFFWQADRNEAFEVRFKLNHPDAFGPDEN